MDLWDELLPRQYEITADTWNCDIVEIKTGKKMLDVELVFYAKDGEVENAYNFVSHDKNTGFDFFNDLDFADKKDERKFDDLFPKEGYYTDFGIKRKKMLDSKFYDEEVA